MKPSLFLIPAFFFGLLDVSLSNGVEFAPLFEVVPSEGGLLRHIDANFSSVPEGTGRSKREASVDGLTPLSVDLLVLVDYSLYQRFLSDSRGNGRSADAAVHRYFTQALLEVGRIYEGLRAGRFRFKLWPAGVVIAKSPEASPWIGAAYFADNGTEPALPLDAYHVLKELKSWLRGKSTMLPEYDHVIAFTKKDLHRFGDGLAQGIAYVKSICHPRHSASVAEDVGAMATVAVIAHELAHSLGAEHDGSGEAAGCPVNLNYLMVPSVSSQPQTLHNTFRFSNCSLRQISDYLESHPTSTSCLYHSARDGVRYQGDGRRTAPGQLYDAHQQCRQAFGATFRFCASEDYYLTQLCRRLWCRDSRESRFSQCFSKHYLPAFFGTSCGHKMWCMNGACVEDEAAPAREGCKFGDRDSGFCVRLVSRQPSACAVPTYSRFCCKTCRNYKVFGVADGMSGYRHRHRMMNRFRFLN